MIIDRIFTPGLAQVAYFVADETAGVAAIIDPRRDIDDYLRWLAERELRLTAILETHVHADFVSGARELAAVTNAPILTSRLGDQEFPHQPLDDGAEIPVGSLRLRAFWTPGHTPEHLSFLLFDPTVGTAPLALFSGDVLFAGEVGRPDLLGPDATALLADQLYDTVVERLSRLPDEVIVYPGHTAGSPCGKKIGDAPHTTIGQERRFNYAFQAQAKDEFVRMVLAGMPKPPAYYPVMKRVNKVGPVLLRDLADGTPLTADEVATRQAAGALVIDARPPESFSAAHVPGAVAVGLGSNFAIWAGWLAPYDRDLLLVLDEDGQYTAARTELRRIGLDRVVGYLAGGIDSWNASGRPLATLPSITAPVLAERMVGDTNGLVVLDVRDETEWVGGHIPGAINTFAGDIAQGVNPALNGAHPVALICGKGYRSMVAASLLQTRGRDHLLNVTGGMAAWQEARLPIEVN